MTTDDSTRGGIDRRTAIRRTLVGATTATGLLWAAPRVEGLTSRPPYLSVASGAATDATFSLPPGGAIRGSGVPYGAGSVLFNMSRSTSSGLLSVSYGKGGLNGDVVSVNVNPSGATGNSSLNDWGAYFNLVSLPPSATAVIRIRFNGA